jgi:hypothetical protein
MLDLSEKDENSAEHLPAQKVCSLPQLIDLQNDNYIPT